MNMSGFKERKMQFGAGKKFLMGNILMWELEKKQREDGCIKTYQLRQKEFGAKIEGVVGLTQT